MGGAVPTLRRPLPVLPQSAGLLIAVGKLAWRRLPMLVVMDVLVAGAVLPPVAAVLCGYAIAAPALGALCLGPAWAACVYVSGKLIEEEDCPAGLLLRAVPLHAGAGVRAAAPLAFVTTLALAALEALARMPGQRWLALSLLLDGGALTLLFLALPTVFSLAVATPLRGLPLWRVALCLAVLRRATWLEIAVIATILAASLAISHGPGLLPFLPGPLALYLSAATRVSLAVARNLPRQGV
jgi:hypothetical protein